jgi:hypothetical protein
MQESEYKPIADDLWDNSLLPDLAKFIEDVPRIEDRTAILDMDDDLIVLIKRLFYEVFARSIKNNRIKYFDTLGRRQIVQLVTGIFLVKVEDEELLYDDWHVLDADEFLRMLAEWRQEHVSAVERNLSLHRQLTLQPVSA